MVLTSDTTATELVAVATDWLKRRGVPHFLVRQENEHRVLHVFVGIVIATIGGWVLAEGDGLSRGVAAGLAVGLVVAVVAVSVVVRRIQRKDKGYGVMPPSKVNLTTAGALLVTWAIDSAVADEISLKETLILAAALVILLMVAAATPLGAARIIRWAVIHPFRETKENLRVLAGALPLLLLTLAFLLLTDDLWVVATNLGTDELAATLGLFGTLGLAFLVVLAWIRVADAAKFDDWGRVGDCLADRELHRLRDDTDWKALPDVGEIKAMDDTERWNITAVLVFGQAVQVLAVSLVMAGFFLLFGGLTVDDATLAAWKVAPQDGVWRLSGQHLKMAVLLASFAGLSYAVYAALFKEQREFFFCELDRKTTQRLAVRAVYRGLLFLR